MTSCDLTPQQTSDLYREIHRIAMYLKRLARRMAHLQFATVDALFRLVQNAEKSLVPLFKPGPIPVRCNDGPSADKFAGKVRHTSPRPAPYNPATPESQSAIAWRAENWSRHAPTAPVPPTADDPSLPRQIPP